MVLEIKHYSGITKPPSGDVNMYAVQGTEMLFPENMLDNFASLDSDYINEHYGELQDEAYVEGKKVGIEEGKAIGYEQCAIDAQKVIHKIFNTHKGCLLGHEMDEIFGTRDCVYILLHHSIKEIISKIEAWEKAKTEIKVGDVVMDTENDVFVVLRKLDDFVYALLNSKGKHKYSDVKYLTKTGRTIDIASVLSQIGGTA